MQREDLKKYALPEAPGVYLFRDSKRQILYVGKATSLVNRVRSYFSSDLTGSRGARIVTMIDRAKRVEWYETGSVLEALILEANLIKKHQPPYNVDEKDDKSWNYVVITKEDFPRVLIVRGRELLTSGKKPMTSKQFGPFPQGGLLKEALKIVRRIFPYRDTCTPCKKQYTTRETFGATPPTCRPCFNRQLGLCPGVCSGEVSKVEYARAVRHIAQLFSGNMQGLKRQLDREMYAAAKAQKFEEAATVRKQIHALQHIRDVSLIKNETIGALTSERAASIRIEAYDAAHTSGKETVAVMTVVRDGEPLKSDYRKFKIHTATNDDVSALKEALSRRLAHTEWPLPRIFVVDGGRAQVRAAERIVREAGIQIPIVGVVKNESHKPERLIGDARIITIHEREIILANSEAHRFAIQWHRTRLRRRIVA